MARSVGPGLPLKGVLDMPLTLRERQAVLREFALRYRRARKREKSALLDEAARLLGYNRAYAARALRQALRSRPKSRLLQPHRGRPPTYGMPVKRVLVRVWAIMSFASGKRLAPFMGELVEALERHGELDLPQDLRAQLLAMSPATMDRLLAPERKRLELKGRAGTRPGSLLKHGIPIRTFADRMMRAPASSRSTWSRTMVATPGVSSARRST